MIFNDYVLFDSELTVNILINKNRETNNSKGEISN